MLFYAPVGTSPDETDRWIPLGEAESCEMQYDEDPLTDALIGFDLHGRCASVSFPIGGFTPYGFRLLFRRKHPRIKAIRSAYRRKSR